MFWNGMFLSKSHRTQNSQLDVQHGNRTIALSTIFELSSFAVGQGIFLKLSEKIFMSPGDKGDLENLKDFRS